MVIIIINNNNNILAELFFNKEQKKKKNKSINNLHRFYGRQMIKIKIEKESKIINYPCFFP